MQVLSVVGLLQDEADPMVSVMKVCPRSGRRPSLLSVRASVYDWQQLTLH